MTRKVKRLAWASMIATGFLVAASSSVLYFLRLRPISAASFHVAKKSQSADASDRVFRERLKAIAGANAVDCGSAPSNAPQDTVAACGLNAFHKHEPFFLGYYTRYGDVVGFAYGVAEDSSGNAFSVSYQGFREFPAVAPNHHTRLMDNNHIRVAECIKPVDLGREEQGLLGCITPVNQAESEKVAHQPVIDTTVCGVAKDPPAFNNRLVRVRGQYSGNFEYSLLGGDGCPEALWFSYGEEGGAPPSLVMYVSGGARPGSEDADGKLISPVPVKLVRDAKFDGFERQVRAMARTDSAYEKKHPGNFVSHCVTATVVGRVDSVSPEVHEFRKNHPSNRRSDWLGFGQMGLFEAQFVLESVEDDARLGVCRP